MEHLQGIRSLGAQYISDLKRAQADAHSQATEARSAQIEKMREQLENDRVARHHGKETHSRGFRNAEGDSESTPSTFDTRYAAMWVADREVSEQSNENLAIGSTNIGREVIRSAKAELLTETATKGAESIVAAVTEKIDAALASGGLSTDQAEAVTALRDAFTEKVSALLEKLSDPESTGDLKHEIRMLTRGIKRAFRELYGGLEEVFASVPEATQTPNDTTQPVTVQKPISAEPAVEGSTSTTEELMIQYRIDRPGDNDTDVSIYIKVSNSASGTTAAEETTAFDTTSFLSDLTQAFKSEFIEMREDIQAAKAVVGAFGHHGRVDSKDSQNFLEALDAFIKILQEKLAALYEQQQTGETSAIDATDDATDEVISGAVKPEESINVAV